MVVKSRFSRANGGKMSTSVSFKKEGTVMVGDREVGKMSSNAMKHMAKMKPKKSFEVKGPKTKFSKGGKLPRTDREPLNNLLPFEDGGKIKERGITLGSKKCGGKIKGCGGKFKMKDGGKIHIKPSKRGTFTTAATKHGQSVQGFASKVLANKGNYSPAMVKKANFARNASKWNK